MTRDDPYWKSLLAKRDTLPIAEQVEQSRGYNLTKYTADRVLPALVDLCDAHDEAVRAYAVACEFVDARVPAEDKKYPGWQRYVDDDVKAVLEARWKWFDGADRPLNFGLQFGVGRACTSESYPLSNYAERARRYRRAARELLKVVESQTRDI